LTGRPRPAPAIAAGILAALLGWRPTPAPAAADEPLRCTRSSDGSESAYAIGDPQWTCGARGLGCVDDPRSAAPRDGLCGACAPDAGIDAPAGQRESSDCGGAVCNRQRQCQAPPDAIPLDQPLVPKRFLLTATALVSWTDQAAGGRDADLSAGLGGFFEIGLGRSRVARAPDNHVVHTVPSLTYAHVGASFLAGAPHSVLFEGGPVWRIDFGPLTRFGVMYAGQIYGAPELLGDPELRHGASLQVEIMANLIVKVSYLHRDPDDQAFVGVELMRTLLDDVLRIERSP